MNNYKKLNKSQLKQLIKEYQNDLQKKLTDVKQYKLSKMKKAEILTIVEGLFNSPEDDPLEFVVDPDAEKNDDKDDADNKNDKDELQRPELLRK